MPLSRSRMNAEDNEELNEYLDLNPKFIPILKIRSSRQTVEQTEIQAYRETGRQTDR